MKNPDLISLINYINNSSVNYFELKNKNLYLKAIKGNESNVCDCSEEICCSKDIEILEIKSEYVAKIKKIFVKEKNTSINKGDILCIIEFLRLDIEIYSQFNCQLIDVHISENDLIEYGTVLFSVSII